mgnify:CR=1 FL=1
MLLNLAIFFVSFWLGYATGCILWSGRDRYAKILGDVGTETEGKHLQNQLQNWSDSIKEVVSEDFSQKKNGKHEKPERKRKRTEKSHGEDVFGGGGTA